jgi:hypothetical protein
MNTRTLMVMLSDGLRVASGFVSEASYRCLVYCRVPEDWVEGDLPSSGELWLKGPTLTSAGIETLFRKMYGDTWREGNADGSQYVVLSTGARLLNPSRSDETPWRDDDSNDKQFRYFFFVAGADGRFASVKREAF